MAEVASKVIEFMALGQRVLKETGVLSLKSRFLFALKDKSSSPKDLCEILKQDKTNVAHLANSLLAEGLITKSTFIHDRRQIRYCLSEQGRQKLNSILLYADQKLASLSNLGGDLEKLSLALDEAVRLLSFM